MRRPCSALLANLCASAVTAAAVKPHVVFTLTDDLGWNTAWHNSDIDSPTLNALAKGGVELLAHYTYRYCSPTRAAFLTGRSPYKLLNIRENLIPTQIPESTDTRFTMLPKRLQEADYVSYQIGKWHQGSASPAWTPVGRGFSESFGFLAGGEDHFTQINGHCTVDEVSFDVTDYWEERAGTPGRAIASCNVPELSRVECPLFAVISKNQSAAVATTMCQNGQFANCAFGNGGPDVPPCFQCKTERYTGFDFALAAVEKISNHTVLYDKKPMFMYLALHNTHGPIEAPPEYEALYMYSDTKRNTFDAMVSVVDRTVKNVTNALKDSNMWHNCLFIWTTDNGSPCQVSGSNDPLRGNKGSDWEGGSRTPTFINGGLIPSNMAGKKLSGIVAVWDWFATIAALAGIDPKEPNPQSPSPVDSYDVFPYITGTVQASPRTELVYDHLQFDVTTTACVYRGNIQVVPCNGGGAIRVGDLKLLVGTHGWAGLYGHWSPNASYDKRWMENITLCSFEQPCLFNVSEPNGESHNLAASMPAMVQKLRARFDSYAKEYHPPSHPPAMETDEYCTAALHNGGFSAPWRSV